MNNCLCNLFENDVYEAISLEKCVGDRKVRGGPAPESVQYQVDKVRKIIDNK